MSYKLNNVDISVYGAVPVVQGQRMALEGVFDLPKRIGTTEYNWGTSIEPFVDADDIQIDGRELVFNVAIKADDIQTLRNKVIAFNNACLSCTSISTDFDMFNVICKDEIKVTEYGLTALIVVKLWQNEVILPAISILPSNSGAYQIDGYDLQNDFGIHVTKIDGLLDIPGRIDVSTTDSYTRIQYRDLRDLTLVCVLKGGSIPDMYTKIKQFHSLCYNVGMRSVEIDAVQFDSRNLILNSKSHVQVNGFVTFPLSPDMVSGSFMLSFDYICTAIDGIGISLGFANTYDGSWKYTDTLAVGNGHKSMQVNFTRTNQTHFVLYTNNSTIYSNIKLEKGSKSTDWSPAPEDVKSHVNIYFKDGFKAELIADDLIKFTLKGRIHD